MAAPVAAAVRTGDRRAVAAQLSAIESGTADIALLDDLHETPRAHVLGITGPPGVGKSTLIRSLIGIWRARGETVGVLAVDPSSGVSGGALLGDRLRMGRETSDNGCFIRSMASGACSGGLAPAAFAAVTVLRAAFDRVIVETVGVGQSETGIAGLADTVLLCVQPNAGDVVQFMKAGIMEAPDVLAVTKADTGPAAERTLADLRAAQNMTPPRAEWSLPAVLCAATADGLKDVFTALEQHENWLSADGHLETRRAGQAVSFLRERLAQIYGSAGLGWSERMRPEAFANPRRPFAALAELDRLLAEKTGLGR